jgi:hypothetical protein
MPRAVPAHPACHGVRGGCAVCTCHLHARRNCLAGATSTVACSLCAEAADLQVCDLWRKFDKTSRLSALQGWNGGERQDPEERPVTPRLGVPRNPEYDIIWQLLAFQRDAGLAAHPNCTKRQHPGPEQRCPLCPRMFPRTARDGRGFVKDRAPSSSYLSHMIVDGFCQVCFDTTLFSGKRTGISTRRGRPRHRHRGRRPGTHPLNAERHFIT